jgi:hypothetical protein
MSAREVVVDASSVVLRWALFLLGFWLLLAYCQDQREARIGEYAGEIEDALYEHLSGQGIEHDRAFGQAQEYAEVARQAMLNYDPPGDPYRD